MPTQVPQCRDGLQILANIPIEAYPILLQTQVQKGFHSAGPLEGGLSPYAVDIAIKRLKVTKGMFVLPDPSVLHVTVELRRPDGGSLMKGELESRYLPSMPVIVPGFVGVIATGFEGQELQALKKLIPALAVAFTRVTEGLQSGKGLDAIKVYPEDIRAGDIVSSESFLRGNPYGSSELTAEDISAAISLPKGASKDTSFQQE